MQGRTQGHQARGTQAGVARRGSQDLAPSGGPGARMRWAGWEPKTQAAWGSRRDGAARPASYVPLLGSSQAWRDGGQRMGTRLTFIVSGVRREADVHGPLDRTVEAVCVRAGVAERRAGGAVSTGQRVSCTHTLGHADRQTHVQTQTQPRARGHSDTRMQTHTQINTRTHMDTCGHRKI